MVLGRSSAPSLVDINLYAGYGRQFKYVSQLAHLDGTSVYRLTRINTGL